MRVLVGSLGGGGAFSLVSCDEDVVGGVWEMGVDRWRGRWGWFGLWGWRGVGVRGGGFGRASN